VILRSIAFAVVVALVSSLSTTPPKADATRARAHYERGTSLYQVGEYRQALDEFKQAHIEKADPAFLYNIAQCHRQLGESKEALTFYRRYLSLAPNTALQRTIAELPWKRDPNSRSVTPTTRCLQLIDPTQGLSLAVEGVRVRRRSALLSSCTFASFSKSLTAPTTLGRYSHEPISRGWIRVQ